MKVFWQQCEGQVIDGFPLRQYLGGGEDQAVFLTEYAGETPRKAIIKLTHADPESTEDHLRLWRLSSELSHPNLMRLFERGTWQLNPGQLNKFPLLYVVMEYADEDLSQVIPERPLTVEEAKEVLEPALSALAYLHSSGFVHGHLKPSNFMAIDGRLKISSDRVSQAGAGPLTATNDVWSLGMTLVEVLTQRLPVWNPAGAGDPVLPENMPPEFREIAQHALRRDPSSRWTVAQIQQRLSGRPAASGKRLSASATTTAVLVVALAIVAGTLFIRRKQPAAVPPTPVQAAQPAPTQPAPTQPAPTQPAPAQSAPPPVEPSAPRTESKPSPIRPTHGEIAKQVLPEVLPRARNTIQGRVAASVRVEVDPSGDVANATIESAGPSPYFSGLALNAARRWKFVPSDSRQVWILKFEFTRSGTKVAPIKVAHALLRAAFTLV
jgi:TonB family protein